MFFGFKKKVSIKSLSIPDLGWSIVKDEKDIMVWVNPTQTMSVSVNFFNLPPDIPSSHDVNIIRHFHRQRLLQTGTHGIVQVELNKNRLKTIFKVQQAPSGISYIGSLTYLYRDCSFVIKITAPEPGPTGMREAMVANELLAKGIFDENEWAFDPYDKDMKEGVFMNIAEMEVYDTLIPNHHLTKTRALLRQLENEITWRPEIATLAPFTK